MVVKSALWALALAIIISVLITPIMIPFLTRLKVGQSVRSDGPKRHLSKAGTPTMGGIIIITAVMGATFILAGSSSETWTAVLIMLAFGAVGFADDYIKVVLKRSLGLRAREKIILQVVISLLFGMILLFYFQHKGDIAVPFISGSIDLGFMYIPFLIIVMLATANTVNLTDGLDGLASGVTFFVAIAFTLVCFMTENYQLAIFCSALAGACIGFLIFNRYPARIFMGDTGSMAMGGAIAAVAALTGTELFLLIIGGVYVIEGLSVILQVLSFQLTGKRIFLMSPLHHHFELKGWHETKVVRMFWLMSLIFVIVGLLGFKGIG